MRQLTWNTCPCGRAKAGGRRVCEVCEASRNDASRRAFESAGSLRASQAPRRVLRRQDPARERLLRSINRNAERQRQARRRANALAGFTAWVLLPLGLLLIVLLAFCGLASLILSCLHSMGFLK